MTTRKIELEDVAVVVATRNDGSTLRTCLDSLWVAGQGKAEIWVVNDGSTDDTEAILETYKNQIHILKGLGEGPGKARNWAMRSSSKPWIAFTDGDCKVSETWLTDLCAGLQAQMDSVIAMGGPQRISSEAEDVEREIGRFLETVGFVSDYLHDDTEIREVPHNPTCNVIYARRALEAVGGFDEELWPCEDLELDLRLGDRGFKMAFHPGAEVEHRRPATWKDFLRMMKRYGFAHAQLVKKRGICQRLHFLPALVPLFLALLVGLLWFFPLLAGVAAGLLVSFVFFAFLGLTRSARRSLTYSFILMKVVVAWLLGFYSGIFGQRRIARKHV